MIFNIKRETETATSVTVQHRGGDEDKEKEAGRINAVYSHRGLRPRTVSKPRRSLQGGCGPLVRHNYWHAACLLRMETLRGAGAEALLLTGGQDGPEMTILNADHK